MLSEIQRQKYEDVSKYNTLTYRQWVAVWKKFAKFWSTQSYTVIFAKISVQQQARMTVIVCWLIDC